MTHLSQEYALLSDALAAADPAAKVPTCPDWTVADLEQHVAMVYLHKAECLRRGEFPTPWPPDSAPALADAYPALLAEIGSRRPEDRAVTWFDADQTVGFWIRRMAQETVIHRVDAEIAAGRPVSPIAPDLAVDGIDELLWTFVAFASQSWPEDFADVLPDADHRPILVVAEDPVVGRRAWTVTATPERILIANAAPDTTVGAAAAAIVTGEPGSLDRWLWSRGGDVTVAGDEALAAQLSTVIAPAMQ